jgi:hypothetical protein
MNRDAETQRLIDAAIKLNNIVEGVASTRWFDGRRRLKDTPEWVEFYLALNRVPPELSALPKLGEKSTCCDCGTEIEYIGVYWRHVGTNPRHVARPFRSGGGR